MEHDDLFDELRAANPYAGDGATPPTKTSADARFKEITMQPHDTHSPRRNPAAAPSRWRPMIAVPSALALIAVVVVSALVFSAVTAPSAYALVTEAAQNSAGFDSGRVEIAIELREVPDDDTTGTMLLDYRYDGDDYVMVNDFTQLDGFDAPEVGDEIGNFTVIQSGDSVYTKLPGLGTGDNYLESEVGEEEIFDDAGFGINPETIDPQSIVALIEKADDFSEVDSEDDTTTYKGSVSLDVIKEIGVDSLPPGLALLADGSNTDLPETLGLTASVQDGKIAQLIVDIVGDTPDGYTDATITTTFSDLGVPQEIVAPPADQIADFNDLEDLAVFEIPEGFEDAMATLEDLEQRRPELCAEIWEGFEDPTVAVDAGAFEQIGEDFANCLIDAGEPEAAEAWRTMSDFGSE